MWIRAVSRTDRVAKFFRIALSHETLANYIQTNFGLIQHHRWSLAEFDSSCFDGKYITGDVNEDYLLALDELRNDAEKRKKTQTDDTFDEVVVY